MDNIELLQAMRDMMKEEISGLRQEMNDKFDGVTERLDAMQEDIAEIKEDTAITRSATNSLVKWADDVAVITQIKFPVKEAK